MLFTEYITLNADLVVRPFPSCRFAEAEASYKGAADLSTPDADKKKYGDLAVQAAGRRAEKGEL